MTSGAAGSHEQKTDQSQREQRAADQPRPSLWRYQIACNIARDAGGELGLGELGRGRDGSRGGFGVAHRGYLPRQSLEPLPRDRLGGAFEETLPHGGHAASDLGVDVVAELGRAAGVRQAQIALAIHEAGWTLAVE